MALSCVHKIIYVYWRIIAKISRQVHKSRASRFPELKKETLFFFYMLQMLWFVSFKPQEIDCFSFTICLISHVERHQRLCAAWGSRLFQYIHIKWDLPPRTSSSHRWLFSSRCCRPSTVLITGGGMPEHIHRLALYAQRESGVKLTLVRLTSRLS